MNTYILIGILYGKGDCTLIDLNLGNYFRRKFNGSN